LTPEQEGQIVLRQRDTLMVYLRERAKWCPLVEINDIYRFFDYDPAKDLEEVEDDWPS
jgi:hypothetical protein